MGWLDWCLLAVAAVWLGVSLWCILRKKTGGCGGDCGACAKHCGKRRP